MAGHAYTVTSATYIPGADDPQVTVVGTVDGVAVTIQVWLSALTKAWGAGGSAGLTAVKNLISPMMLAQSIVNNPPAPQAPASLPTGSWSQ